jgi:hypothetical protein
MTNNIQTIANRIAEVWSINPDQIKKLLNPPPQSSSYLLQYPSVPPQKCYQAGSSS